MPDSVGPDGVNPNGFRPDGFRPDGFTPDGVSPDGVSPGGVSPDEVTSISRAGRPKDNAKHAAIISAAKHLFARLPFELVTMEAVATQAQVSKMTIYSHFHDKEMLFETVVGMTAHEMIRALSAPQDGGSLRDTLATVGIAFLTVILGSDICAMAHTLPGALRGNQPLAMRFYAAGPGRVRAALSAIIAAAASKKQLTVDHPDHAADDLVSLWEGNLPAKLAFGIVESVSAAEVERRAIRGTDIFLRAYRRTADSAGDVTDRSLA